MAILLTCVSERVPTRVPEYINVVSLVNSQKQNNMTTNPQHRDLIMVSHIVFAKGSLQGKNAGGYRRTNIKKSCTPHILPP